MRCDAVVVAEATSFTWFLGGLWLPPVGKCVTKIEQRIAWLRLSLLHPSRGNVALAVLPPIWSRWTSRVPVSPRSIGVRYELAQVVEALGSRELANTQGHCLRAKAQGPARRYERLSRSQPGKLGQRSRGGSKFCHWKVL